MKEYLLDLFSFGDYQDDPRRWDFLTDEDKRVLKKFGVAVFILFVLTLWAENYFHGVF